MSSFTSLLTPSLSQLPTPTPRPPLSQSPPPPPPLDDQLEMPGVTGEPDALPPFPPALMEHDGRSRVMKKQTLRTPRHYLRKPRRTLMYKEYGLPKCFPPPFENQRVLQAVDVRAASATPASAPPLLLPPKCSYFTSSYPTDLFGSGCYKQPLPLPKP